MNLNGTLHLLTVDGTGLRFEARFASHRTILDSGRDVTATNPVETLLASLAACEGMDVIEILRKKRLNLTGYEIAMHATRSDAHPRRLLSVELVHRVTGRDVSETAVAEAVRLSEERYCSVYHSLDPGMPITSRVEVLRAPVA